jgi:hypothetical protein
MASFGYNATVAVALKLAAVAPAARASSATALVTRIREVLFSLPDHRRGGNNQAYAIGEAGLRALSAFFMQSPSFLDTKGIFPAYKQNLVRTMSRL